MAIGRDVGNQEWAEKAGLAALLFVTEEEERLGRFLGETGLSPGDLAQIAGTPEGLVAVLDHLLADESLLMVFAAGAGLDPADVGMAREMLGGGGDAQRFSAEHYTSGHASGRGTGRPAAKKASKRWPGPGA